MTEAIVRLLRRQMSAPVPMLDSDDARAILAHIDALTAERDTAVAALNSIAKSTGCGEACPCWAKLRRKAERAIERCEYRRTGDVAGD